MVYVGLASFGASSRVSGGPCPSLGGRVLASSLWACRVPPLGLDVYLLITLPLALTIEQVYPAYAPYPLPSPLVGFADDTNLTVAHIPHVPHTRDPGPTVS